MAEFKRQTFTLSTGKQIRLHGNSFFINRSLEIGEGFVPNIFSLFEEQSDGNPSSTVSNPYRLTAEELAELADYNIRLWLDLKDSIRNSGINNPKVFSRVAELIIMQIIPRRNTNGKNLILTKKFGKQHTVIGFPNNVGGDELRNENFKGSVSPKDTTFIDNKTEQIAVFEGFFSFLSFCTINKSQTAPLTNCLVLNSLSFLDKSRDLMEKHVRVHLLLDWDAAGKKHTEKALNWNRDRYIDKSEYYGAFKDLNEWLIHDRNSLQQSQRQGRRP